MLYLSRLAGKRQRCTCSTRPVRLGRGLRGQLAVGQEDYDRLRPLSYSNASVFLLCFSVASRASYENIREKWYPELRRYSPKVPFILVGTQADRRPASPASAFVLQAEGVRTAKDLGAVSYVECSALTREGLREVFVNAILAAFNLKNSKAAGSAAGKRKKCSLV